MVSIANLASDATRALIAADIQAARMHHEYIGTEHLVLGIVQEPGSQAVGVLEKLGVAPAWVRERVHAVVASGRPSATPIESRPLTRRCQTAMAEASHEARSGGRELVTSCDLLIGLLLEHRGLGAQVLESLGVRLDLIRESLRSNRND